LSKQNELMTLSLVDDGKGFDVQTKKLNGIGLQNMKKRAEIIGGTFILNSTKNGTTVLITLPFEA